MHFTTALLSLLAATAVSAQGATATDKRPCGFKIAPCPTGEVCEKLDPKCDRGENCAGVCVATTPSLPTPTRRPRPTPYKRCGGFRINPQLQCEKDEVCIDDPFSGGCGMACDQTGICVKPVFCGGFAGFQCEDKTKTCVDDPRDDCDPKNGGADCGGLCV